MSHKFAIMSAWFTADPRRAKAAFIAVTVVASLLAGGSVLAGPAGSGSV
jgi:hypothetical protein